MQTLILVITEFAAVAHFMMSLVMFYLARRSVQFLSQAWIMLLFCLLYCGALCFVATHSEIPQLGIFHPVLLIYLLACSYLQSIYPLGLCMPGYLQWGRMWGYAVPALVCIFLYCIGSVCGSNLANVYTVNDIGEYFLSGDVLLRIISLLLSVYYIVNIFRLPHRLVKRMQLPRDIIFYGSALGFVSVFFVVIAANFNLVLLTIYMVLFTSVNMFLFFRTLRPTVNAISYPSFRQVEKPPTRMEIVQTEADDFNEANQRRFEAMEYVMQNEKPFVSCDFNRERLCRLAGFNRHMALQSLRSQGYNDTHEYIMRYRVAEMVRRIKAGELTDLRQVNEVGFRTIKTAVSCYERYEGGDLVRFFEQTVKKPSPESPAEA